MRWADAVVAPDSAPPPGKGPNLRFRSPTRGPERALIEGFLGTQVVQVPPGREVSVFIEPGVELSYPDVVAVLWRPATASAWPAERAALTRGDIHLLALLTTHSWNGHPSKSGWFELTDLGPRRGLAGSLDRLEAAGLLLRGSRKVRARAIRDIFAVERIIAVEAKTSMTEHLLRQAHVNTWFASESYALAPIRRAQPSTLTSAAGKDVGLLGHVEDETRMLRPATKLPMPGSDHSWAFNEWVWRLQSGEKPVGGSERKPR